MHEKMVLIAPDCTDARVVKRFHAFTDQHLVVIGMTFRRLRYNNDYEPFWENIDLGLVKDRKYGERIIVIIQAMLKIFLHRSLFRDASSVYVINLDSAFLGLFVRLLMSSRNKIKLIYEVADIQKPFVKSGLMGFALRRLERYLLMKIDLLVVTSPQFVDCYYLPVQHYARDWFLLENKLYPPVPQRRASNILSGHAKVWNIGFFGALKCKRSWSIIKELIRSVPNVVFYLRGTPTLINAEDFYSTIERNDRLIYDGEYQNPSDLAEIYAKVDLTWGFDYTNEGFNSTWCLPNRIYESGAYSVPVLAQKRTATGEYVSRLGIGWVFDGLDIDELASFFKNLEVEEYMRTRGALAKMDSKNFVDDAQYAILTSLMCASNDSASISHTEAKL